MNDPNLTTVEEMLFMDRLLDNLEKEGIDTSKLKNNAAFMNDPLNFDVNAFLKRSVVSGLEDSNHSVSAATAFAAGVGDGTTVERHGKGAKSSVIKSVFAFARRKVVELGQGVVKEVNKVKEVTKGMLDAVRSPSMVKAAAGVAAALVLVNGFNGATADNPSERHSFTHPVLQEYEAEQAAKEAQLAAIRASNERFQEAVNAIPLHTIIKDFLETQSEAEQDAMLTAAAVNTIDKHFKEAQVTEKEMTVTAVTADAPPSVPMNVYAEKPNIVEPSGDLFTSISDGIKKSRNRHNNLEQSTISQFVGHLAITEAANEVMATNADPDNPQYERQQFENAVVAGLMTIEGLYKQEIAGGATERSAFNDSLEQLSYLTLSAAANDADMSTLGTSAAITLAKKNPEVIKDSNIDSAGMAKYLATEAAKSIEAQGKERMIRVALDGITDVAYSHAEDKSGINLDPEKAKLSAGGLYIGVDDLPSSLSPTDVSKVLSRVAERGVKNVPHSDPSGWSRLGTNTQLFAADMQDKSGAAYDKTAEFASSAYNATTDVAGAAYDKTAEFASNAASSIKLGAGSAYNATTEMGSTAFDATKGAFGKAYAFAASKFSNSNPDQNAEVSTPTTVASADRSM